MVKEVGLEFLGLFAAPSLAILSGRYPFVSNAALLTPINLMVKAYPASLRVLDVIPITDILGSRIKRIWLTAGNWGVLFTLVLWPDVVRLGRHY